MILEGAEFALYVGSGWMVFTRGHDVFAVPFDLETMRVNPPPVKAPEKFVMSPNYGVPQLDVSRDGALVYVSGPPSVEPITEVLILDRRGIETRLPMADARYEYPRLSPDGRRLAMTRCDGRGCRVFVVDRDRQVLFPVTPEPGRYLGPVWSPTGERLAFSSILRGSPRLAVKAADGGGAIEPLTPDTDDAEFPNAWSPDGRTIAYTVVYTRGDGGSRLRHTSDIWLAAVDGSSPPRPWTETPFSERAASFSPDGRFLAYVSDESGSNEVYLRPVDGGGKVQISSGGGEEPLWIRGARELLYRHEGRFYSVGLGAGPDPVAGAPRVVLERQFDSSGQQSVFLHQWDASRDGREFFVLRTTPPVEPPRELRVVTSWLGQLDRLRQRGGTDSAGALDR